MLKDAQEKTASEASAAAVAAEEIKQRLNDSDVRKIASEASGRASEAEAKLARTILEVAMGHRTNVELLKAKQEELELRKAATAANRHAAIEVRKAIIVQERYAVAAEANAAAAQATFQFLKEAFKDEATEATTTDATTTNATTAAEPEAGPSTSDSDNQLPNHFLLIGTSRGEIASEAATGMDMLFPVDGPSREPTGNTPPPGYETLFPPELQNVRRHLFPTLPSPAQPPLDSTTSPTQQPEDTTSSG